MLSTKIQKSLGDQLLSQEELILVSQGNHMIHSFKDRQAAEKWLEARNKRPGVHPTVRLVKRTVTFEELGAIAA
jgi:hypothetical protein